MNNRPTNAQAIIAANDILKIIGSYFPLVYDGSRHRARCPFHDEQRATFTVDVDRQTFQCFGCGAGGDVVRFVMAYEHDDEDRALRKLASRVGMPVLYAPPVDG